MLYQRVANIPARTRHQLNALGRETSLKHQFGKRTGNAGCIRGRFQDYGVPGDQRGDAHSRQNCQREIPWRNHHTHSQRQVNQFGALVRLRMHGVATCKPQHFPAVILAEVDGLSYVRFGLHPTFAGFQDEQGIQIHLALPHQTRQLERETDTFLSGNRTPSGEKRVRCFHGTLGICSGSPGMFTYHLRRSRGVKAHESLAVAYPFAIQKKREAFAY